MVRRPYRYMVHISRESLFGSDIYIYIYIYLYLYMGELLFNNRILRMGCPHEIFQLLSFHIYLLGFSLQRISPSLPPRQPMMPSRQPIMPQKIF